MRRGVDLLREQNLLFFDGLLKIALAEAEARAGDPGRAVAILDEALATADRLGYRAFEAELHRARGDMLLMRDPADPAPAEEALQARDRHCARARNPQLRTARGAGARETLPVDRPARRRPRRPRARPRRLSADAGNAGDRRGGGVACVPGGDGGGQGGAGLRQLIGRNCRRPCRPRRRSKALRVCPFSLTRESAPRVKQGWPGMRVLPYATKPRSPSPPPEQERGGARVEMPEIAEALALLAALGRETPLPTGEGYPPVSAARRAARRRSRARAGRAAGGRR